MKLRKKLQAGARYFLGLPVSGAEAWREFLGRAGLGGVKALAGVDCGGGDPALAVSLVEELRMAGAAGVHLTAREPGAYGEALKAAGR